MNLFNEFLYRPLFNALIFIYDYLPDIGISIIILTVLIRIILFPLFYKGAKDMAIMQGLSPKIKEIQKKHKSDRQKQAEALMKVYKDHKVSPFSGFLLIIVQVPIMIAFYRIFLTGFPDESLNSLYSFIVRPESLSHYFLGIIDLSKRNFFLAISAAVFQYFQGKLSLPKTKVNFNSLNPFEKMGRQMIYIGPVMTFVFLYILKFPSAIALFWLTTTIFSVIQQLIINKELASNERISKQPGKNN